MRLKNTMLILCGVALLGAALQWVWAITQPIYPSYEYNSLPDVQWADYARLESSVRILSAEERTTSAGLQRAQGFIIDTLIKNGVPASDITVQPYTVDSTTFYNIVVQKTDTLFIEQLPKIVIGAHYDSAGKLPGADDNASGVAGLLELARMLYSKPPTDRTFELVFFASEEPPYFGTEHMGSYHHAHKKDQHRALILVLEMIGYFSDEPQSQHYPSPVLAALYPTTGNFIALVSNLDATQAVRQSKGLFTAYFEYHGHLDVVSLTAPTFIRGVDFSDHRNYWETGVPALMVTDTAFYRNAYYHTEYDTYEKLDYEKMAHVVNAVFVTVHGYPL